MTYIEIVRATGAAAMLATALGTAPASAAGDHSGGHGHSDATADIGAPAKPAQADRTVKVVMTDTAYSIDSLTVSAGETVTFEVRNDGALVHEFNIGTKKMHEAHQDEMQHMMEEGTLSAHHMDEGGHHHGGAGNSVLLNPGETGTLTWTFEAPMELRFACNVPGHYEAGMHGPITVRPAES
ncbi:cupredoxin domain-containing protein [Roseovarius salinarum]|uniref:cupredoxin domain-containing protein n=1 Tax=Roseovarius salinarum TaxID=1981892 RepID=UPI0018E4ABDB|nr:cupredoxin domain-containing protein [Roseovarius salinarum]